MVIKILNLNKCIEKFGDIGNADIMPVIKNGARKVQRSARDLAPEDTGILKSSIKVKHFVDQLSSIVYTTTEYAIYQEFGTRFMRGKPFMRPALNMHRLGINQSLKKALRDDLKRKAK